MLALSNEAQPFLAERDCLPAAVAWVVSEVQRSRFLLSVTSSSLL